MTQKSFKKFTVPLVYNRRETLSGKPALFSSSVIFTVASKYFIVTSAHTVHGQNTDEFGFMINSTFYNITGLGKVFQPNEEESHDPTKLDVALYELTDRISIKALKSKYTFLKWKQIALSHFSENKSQYFIYGYPEILSTDNDDEKKVIVNSIKILARGVEYDEYIESGIEMTNFLILKVIKRVSLNLKGISGCGVWLKKDISESKLTYQLVGIVTGQDEFATFIFSTKVDIISRILKDCYDLNVDEYSTGN